MSVNKVIIVGINKSYLDLYLSGLSIPEVSNATGIHRSTIRHRLYRLGLVRSRADGVRGAAKKGLLGSGMRGVKRSFSDEWKQKISKAKLGKGRGWTLKPSGYIEITMGPNKHRHQHTVIMERHIGRKLNSDEVVHHIDGNKTNNSIANLQLMTASKHASHHARERLETRERDSLGRFK